MCYKTLFVCLCVLVVCYVSHYTLAYLGRSMQSFRQSPVVDSDTQHYLALLLSWFLYTRIPGIGQGHPIDQYITLGGEYGHLLFT